jgi:predicted CoA-substrate-specific enzyme activase
MTITAGIDLGSTYAKAAIVSETGELLGHACLPTGFQLEQAAGEALDRACAQAGVARADLAYTAATGYGRYLVSFRDVQVTDLTAQSWGARYFFPETRTVLDVGGQTMKALRLDERGRVRSFRLNDKCAAGTGAFLEKTARYLGYRLEEIGPLVDSSSEAVPISGVCAVFAESIT